MSLVTIFNQKEMNRRREAYFAFVRSLREFMFTEDGQYQPATEKDYRITPWILPAFLSSPKADDHNFALILYKAWPNWDDYNVFTSSGIAVVLARFGAKLSPELKARSEDHLNKFTIADSGRKPSAAIFDYMFHGYNDNMPAMATRQMVLAGDVLGRKDFTDAGLFHLEGLCAHFERRGLASEFTSATYTPINLCSMLDISELSTCAEAREMAQACADRMLLDLIGHWHWDTGTSGGAMSRAYTVDKTETLSSLNAYIWYMSGHQLCINPCEALKDDTFPLPIHHARNRGFNIAHGVELMLATHDHVRKEIVDHLCKPRSFPYEINAASDIGQTSQLTGCCTIKTRSYQMNDYWLATLTPIGWSQSTPLHAVMASTPKPSSWKERVAIWHSLIRDTPDYGEPDIGTTNPRAEADHVDDCGYYQTAQKKGSALMLGAIHPNLDGKEVASLKFSLLFGTFFGMPDEIFEGDTALTKWEGTTKPSSWQFLRFGDVYAGIRMTGMVNSVKLPVMRVIKNRYLRIEISLIDGKKTMINPEFRAFSEFGMIIELADKQEAGSFSQFRKQVMATTWEYFHSFYRSSRFIGRNAELQIVDSVTGCTSRFIAIDGNVEPEPYFEATGLDAKLVKLFPDGRNIKQRRISYRPDFVGSPFYPEKKYQVLEADI